MKEAMEMDLDIKGKTLQELGLCSHNVPLEDKLKELAFLLKMDLDALWEEGYKRGDREDKSRLWAEFSGDGNVQAILETLMRIMVIDRRDHKNRDQTRETLKSVGSLSEEQADLAMELLEDDAFFEGYDISNDTIARAVKKMEEEERRHRQFLYEIAAKHISSIASRGDLERRNNDNEDFFEVSAWSLCDALDAAYKAGQDSWKS